MLITYAVEMRRTCESVHNERRLSININAIPLQPKQKLQLFGALEMRKKCCNTNVVRLDGSLEKMQFVGKQRRPWCPNKSALHILHNTLVEIIKLQLIPILFCVKFQDDFVDLNWFAFVFLTT